MSEPVTTAVHAILLLTNVSGNILVCGVILRNRDMRIPINYLVLNLAIADMIFATLLAPLALLRNTFTHPEGVAGSVLCRLLTGGVFGWIGGACSSYTLLAVAVERYHSVMYPLSVKSKFTARKLKVIILICWISSVIVLIPEFLVTDYDINTGFCLEMYPKLWMGKAYSVVWLLLVALLPLSAMTVLYSRVVYTLWLKNYSEKGITFHQKGAMKLRKRVTLMVLTVSVIFGVSWGTSSAMYLLTYFTTLNLTTGFNISRLMVYFNSAINPIVYALVNQRFREKIKIMTSSCRCGPSVNRSLTTNTYSAALTLVQRTTERVPDGAKNLNVTKFL